MRIYQTYRAFLHKSQIPFKELFDYTYGFLQENEFTYKEVLFNFDIPPKYDDFNPPEDFLKKYPYWRVYSVPPVFGESFHRFTNAPDKDSSLILGTSRGQNFLKHKSVDIQKLRDLLSKVPRPFNFPDITVCFNGIDWLKSGGDGFLSFERGIYPSGANFVVFADIEITDKDKPGKILDDSKIVNILNQRFFGMVKTWSDRRCVFTEEEYNRIASLNSEIEPKINAFRERAELERKKYDNFGESVAAALDSAMINFTVKKPIKEFFKGWDYQYQIGFFSVKKILEHGFRLEVKVSYQPGFSTQLTRDISISGLYFRYNLAFDQILHSSQDVVDNLIADCRHIADEAEQRFTELLYQLFGETPEWYFK